ncbi:hypothetical protein, partial [Chryseobacterium indologenes]|uniref:hypothetical protein n=1 Tax=Chryseobacterium indologenes TaxID=253 RepID=UPI001F4B07AF
ARRAHNPKVIGSSPVPATIREKQYNIASLFLFQYSNMDGVCLKRDQAQKYKIRFLLIKELRKPQS